MWTLMDDIAVHFEVTPCAMPYTQDHVYVELEQELMPRVV